MKDYSDATKRFLLAAKNAEIQALKQLSANCQLVTAVKDVIHQMQRERGISNIFLGSKGQRFATQRHDQIKISIDHEQSLRRRLKSLYLNGEASIGHMRLLSNITLALQGMDNLSLLRHKVEELRITPLQATQAYCRLIAGLLCVVFEAADVASDPAITRLLVALFNFMQGKEYAGQERAWGAIGFAETHFDSTLCDKLEQLQIAQKHSFSIFAEFANKEELDTWQAMEEGELLADLERFRGMIRQLADGSSIACEISEVWYDIATKRVDEMQRIEEHLTTRLLSAATQSVIDANANLENHKKQLHQLQTAPLVQSPLTMLFDPQMPGLKGSEDSEQTEINSAEPLSTHRSFYDLLRGQAAHIKRMATELDEAKRAITEQKVIDRAKLLIMQQWQISEDQAYRRLQKSAMEQNMKIADIANIVVKQVGR
ncbi:ANTAR domain-containing protein [Alteromonas pelagimontana]|uniref:ANTAR domain-containing protein n=1 Tax=Alteromonas pelagimontana TaxID=1858656 RepID=A0A6M4MBE8_9ALTE|nr:nitrate regulatory protein [Alteromonas pelagimontana]QJR80349.1 ANTAR domain-containing protein [Alteromonas pelagimontana]